MTMPSSSLERRFTALGTILSPVEASSSSLMSHGNWRPYEDLELAAACHGGAGPDVNALTVDPDHAAVIDIIADVRERRSATYALLASRIDVALTEATLKFGDYSVAAQLSFERKTAEDLGRSIIDGRLFRQVSVLRNRVDRPILLVEGLEPLSSPAGVPWHAVRGALVSVAAVFAVPILYSRDAEESAEIMVTAARQMRRARSTAYCRPGYRPKGWRKRALFILQGLPNIGPRRAQALLGAFGSVRGVMLGTTDELASVDGIGVGAAASISRAIGKERVRQLIECTRVTTGVAWPR